jgi:hypothetical protein
LTRQSVPAAKHRTDRRGSIRGRELETPGSGYPLLPQLPQAAKDALIAQAREQQANAPAPQAKPRVPVSR